MLGNAGEDVTFGLGIEFRTAIFGDEDPARPSELMNVREVRWSPPENFMRRDVFESTCGRDVLEVAGIGQGFFP